MKTNKFTIGLGVSYNPNVKRLETSGKISLQDLFSDYGSPSYNRRQIIGFTPNPPKKDESSSPNSDTK